MKPTLLGKGKRRVSNFHILAFTYEQGRKGIAVIRKQCASGCWGIHLENETGVLAKPWRFQDHPLKTLLDRIWNNLHNQNLGKA
jgi:DMSO/TMAO reductase YedYZ molybdopterin-dependent catalytic subunit